MGSPMVPHAPRADGPRDPVGSPFDSRSRCPPQLSFLEIGPGDDVHEYCCWPPRSVEDLASFGQLYRDRGDAENIFDELKNQWGWGGFTTHDLARCRLAARLVALFYNWWNIFVRLADRMGASGGDHQSALAAARHRHSLPPCATNDAHHRQRARQVGSRRQGAPRRRHVSARPRQNCGAVDCLATLGRDPRQSLSGIPQRSPLALTATLRPKLMQPRVANTQKPDRQYNANCGF